MCVLPEFLWLVHVQTKLERLAFSCPVSEHFVEDPAATFQMESQGIVACTCLGVKVL